MNKSLISNIPDYFYRYIDKTENVDYKEVLSNALIAIENAPFDKWNLIGNEVYAEGKWTIKDILQHLIDCERIFTFRALAFARKDKEQLTSFDENDYVTQSKAKDRTFESLTDEYKLVRMSMIALFESFSEEMLLQRGKTTVGAYSVLSLAYIAAGHQKWHFDIIAERYFPLIK